MTVFFHTLGCKVNQYESQVMLSQFQKLGFSLCAENEQPDVCVINSCTVTENSDKKTQQAINKFRRLYPETVIVLTGCFPQAYPEKSAAISAADIITGTSERGCVAELAVEFFTNHKRIIHIPELSDDFENMSIGTFEGHTRAFIKIQDGCNNFCSYCIIPYSRGKIRSKPLNIIKQELENLANSGFKEVVFIGINLANYGKDLNVTLDPHGNCAVQGRRPPLYIDTAREDNDAMCSFRGGLLTDALKIADYTDGIKRVRLGSLEPDIIDDMKIVELSKLEKLCPHFHLSLQSGCDETLKRMNRRYDTSYYEKIVEKLRTTFENCAITTDIMVGFPGESEEEFNASLQFVEKIGFAKIHVFPYSERSGTKAAEMPDKIASNIKTERAKIMAQTAEISRKNFMQTQLGKTVKVLFETYDGKVNKGYSENYTPVSYEHHKNLTKEIHTIKIK